MFSIETLRRFITEYRAISEHARTGRRPGEVRGHSLEHFVDGWYNPYVDTLARTHRR